MTRAATSGRARQRPAVGVAAAAPGRTGPHPSLVLRAASYTIAALLMVTPLLVLPGGKEAFRLVQGLAAGWLGLASLTLVSLSLKDAGTIGIGSLVRRPAVLAVLPLFAVVAAGGLVTAHPVHFRAAAADFAIGAACLAGWSLALDAGTLRRLLAWTIPPAALAAALGLDQFAGWFGSLDWLDVQAPTARLGLTSTLGNPGDLASLLVLPLLVALHRWRGATTNGRLALAVAAGLMLGALAVTATLAAAASLGLGVLVWTLSSAGRHHHYRKMAVTAGALLLVGVSGLVLATPLRTRVVEKAGQIARGDVNALLTGRLDGWRAAWAMLLDAPLTGVGQGAFRAEYAETRLALESRGIAFFPEQQQVMFATPHNEGLSVAAEQGLPGLAALAWGIWRLLVAASLSVRDSPTDARGTARPDTNGAHDRSLVWAGLAALGLLCVVSFPLHVPAVAWPWLLFLAWVFRRSSQEGLA